MTSTNTQLARIALPAHSARVVTTENTALGNTGAFDDAAIPSPPSASLVTKSHLAMPPSGVLPRMSGADQQREIGGHQTQPAGMQVLGATPQLDPAAKAAALAGAGFTPHALHHAIEQGKHDAFARVMADPRTNCTQRDESGRTPLMVALANRQFDMARVLLKRVDSGLAVRDAQGATAYHYLAYCHEPDIIATMLVHDAVLGDHRNSQGSTPLHMAAAKGNEMAVALLLEVTKFRTEHLNCVDDRHHVPLHLAVQRGHVAVLAKLIQVEGLDLNSRGPDGDTALHMAIRSGHAGIVESLRDCDGVNLNAVNEAGLTAIELAFLNGKPELAFVLMKHPGTDRNPVLPWIEREKGMMDFFRQHAPLDDLFLSDAKLLQSELARWADFARSDGTENLRQKAATNYVLGQLLLRFPPSGLPGSSMHGVKRFQLALAQQLLHDDGRFSVDAQSYASALLDSAPDAPAFDLGGYSFTRNEIEDMAAARGFFSLPQSER